MSWAEAEMTGVALGDQRLNRRAARLSVGATGRAVLGEHSECLWWLDRDEGDLPFSGAGWEEILTPHWERTRERMQR